MRGIANWRGKVRARRANAGAGSESGAFWDEARSAWFNRFAGKSDRSATYRYMEPYVKGHVLEIGPGPGAYTRLLVQAASRVIAVEPSPHMARLLRENLGAQSALQVVESSIEAYLDRLEDYDFALAANVLEGIEQIDEVIDAVATHAKVFSIATWANAVTPEWSKAVQAEILGQTPEPDAPGNEDLLAVLEDLGLAYEVHVPDLAHRFAGREDLVTWVQGFLSVEPGRRQELQRVLRPFIAERDGRYILPNGQKTWIVNVWRRGANGSRRHGAGSA